jgi:gluconolactonase
VDVFRSARIEVVKSGMGWGEGPVVHAGGIVFSDINADAMYLWREGVVTTFRAPSRFTNGNTTDREGRLISCEHGSRRVTRTEDDGSITVLAESFGGKRLNSPNDVVVAADGAVWFTDPPYGIIRGDCGPDAVQELPSSVYRVDPVTGAIEAVIDVLDKPNGIAFSRDGQSLFVSDTSHSNRDFGNQHIFRFDMIEGRPRNLCVFARIEPAAADGFRFDALGQLWTSTGDGVQCLRLDGSEVGRISVGELATNLCLLPAAAGPPGLFVTTPTRALVIVLDPTDLAEGFARP